MKKQCIFVLAIHIRPTLKQSLKVWWTKTFKPAFPVSRDFTAKVSSKSQKVVIALQRRCIDISSLFCIFRRTLSSFRRHNKFKSQQRSRTARYHRWRLWLQCNTYSSNTNTSLPPWSTCTSRTSAVNGWKREASAYCNARGFQEFRWDRRQAWSMSIARVPVALRHERSIAN